VGAAAFFQTMRFRRSPALVEQSSTYAPVFKG
jgi:hypothetical protein